SAATTHTVVDELDYATRYYWRISAGNPCGDGLPGQTFSFTTTPVPGECPLGATPIAIQHSDFETGMDGWSHSGDHDTWALSSARAHGPGHSMLAQDVAYDSDQRL